MATRKTPIAAAVRNRRGVIAPASLILRRPHPCARARERKLGRADRAQPARKAQRHDERQDGDQRRGRERRGMRRQGDGLRQWGDFGGAEAPSREAAWSSWLTSSAAPGRRWCTPKLTIAPKTAAPSAIAIIRMNICEPVAALRSSAPWIDTIKVVAPSSMPIPIRNAPARRPQDARPRLHRQEDGAARHQARPADRRGQSDIEVQDHRRPAAKEAKHPADRPPALTTNPAIPGHLPHDALHIGRQEAADRHIGRDGTEAAEIGERRRRRLPPTVPAAGSAQASALRGRGARRGRRPRGGPARRSSVRRISLLRPAPASRHRCRRPRARRRGNRCGARGARRAHRERGRTWRC